MEKSSRPVRNRKRSRKAWPPGEIHRPIKRLFTPEIKRMLKDWLVRRRENPYPNRDEKKILAVETGLTYTQICNWFANWRRKLKNSGKDPIKKTWGTLIKNYNTNARGNVEQFSICSNDSIWGEEFDDSRDSRTPPQSYPKYKDNSLPKNFCHFNNNNSNSFVNFMKFADIKTDSSMFFDHNYGPKNMANILNLAGHQAQCFQISSTTEEPHGLMTIEGDSLASKILNAQKLNPESSGTFYLNATTTLSAYTPKNSNKYKSHIMEKYLRGLEEAETETDSVPTDLDNPSCSFVRKEFYAQANINNCDNNKEPPSLSKWLESTAKFTPSKNNYIDWCNPRKQSEPKKRIKHESSIVDLNGAIHQKDEMDAALALTNLANNFRTKFYT